MNGAIGARQLTQRFLVVSFRRLAECGECGGTAQHAWVEELEQRPEFTQVVFDGSTGQRQAAAGLEQRLAFAIWLAEFLIAWASSRIT